jgi:hypothetical protein
MIAGIKNELHETCRHGKGADQNPPLRLHPRCVEPTMRQKWKRRPTVGSIDDL